MTGLAAHVAIQTCSDEHRIGAGVHLVSDTPLTPGTDVLSEMPHCFVMFDAVRRSKMHRSRATARHPVIAGCCSMWLRPISVTAASLRLPMLRSTRFGAVLIVDWCSTNALCSSY
jgi:hypothetical protein